MTASGAFPHPGHHERVDGHLALRFELQPVDGRSRGLVPVVAGRSLVDMVADYELAQGFEPTGGYAGLVLASYDFGDLRAYLLGQQEPWPGGRVPLLGCQCGEWGCWPLLATVTVQAGAVSWSRFEQPHRPDRDYSGFGPFTFAERVYRAAVDEAAEPTVTLWRPAGPDELSLVAASGYRAWPPRLPGQPFFYPVLNEEYARTIASQWNVPRDGCGYVTRFQVRKAFLDRYDVHQVGGRTILEYWVPAGDLEELNANIVGVIRVVATYPEAI